MNICHAATIVLSTFYALEKHNGNFPIYISKRSFSIPKGNVGYVLPRSSISLKGVLVHTGVIDCGYTGEISVVLQNLTNQTVIFKRYNRIAQLVVTPLTGLTLVQGTLSTDTDRGEGGFGSSGE